MIPRLALLFLIPLAIFTHFGAKEKIFFMPKESNYALKTFCNDLRFAQKSIKATIYSFTNKKISKALKKAARKGVKIEIIFDKESNLRKNHSRIGDLAKIKNITVYYISGLKSRNKKYKGKMHMKMAIIDNKIIYFGSANWSKSAFSVNYEILYSTNDLAIIKKGLDYFDFIKQKATLY